MRDKLQRHPEYFYLAGLILLIPALLINLGRLNIFMAVDEATRGLVALEMMISGNYITPTINGEFYYNKPPLFNWILIVFYSIFGINELAQRLPTVISLIGFGITIYWFTGKALGKRTGIITAFVFITTGRVLYWESLLGYIDITFAWVVYTGMMFILKYIKEKSYLKLFMISYLFMTIGFFLKGLPAIVFQGITLAVVFVSEKSFRKLFTWQHLAGGMIFIIAAGTYYFLYHQHHSLSLVFLKLWRESAQKSVIVQSTALILRKFFLFPFEMIYHYLPWSLLIIFMFTKGFWRTVNGNTFLKLNLLAFLFNIIPYWTASEVYPKYIMMLVPLILTVSVFFYLKKQEENKKLTTVMEMIFLTAAGLVTIGYLAIPFLPQFHVTSHIVFKSLLLFIISGIFVFLFVKIKPLRPVIFAIILIIGRIALDWFIWPQREKDFKKFEENALEVARITNDQKLYYYHVPMVQYGASFVITREKWEIIRQEHLEPRPGVFYITNETGLSQIKENYDSIKVFYTYPNAEDGRILKLIKITPSPDSTEND